jgi:Cu(I)/Ag(I) efflux system membrane protein CusA/SilA
MIIFINEALAHRVENQSFIDAVVDGSAARLRPKLMTVAAIVFSLLPVLLSKGTGMEILKPIAAPSIGGMISSSIHVLFMTPCLVVIGEDLRRSGVLSRLRKVRFPSFWRREAVKAGVSAE